MAELKTKITEIDPIEFIKEIEDESKRKDCLALIKLFQSVTKKKPKVWGNGTIGFGTYYYESEKSSQKGEWMATGFAARKQNLTVYIMSGLNNYSSELKKLGKHKISGGSCIYIKNLEDIDLDVLKKLIQKSVLDLGKKYKVV